MRFGLSRLLAHTKPNGAAPLDSGSTEKASPETTRTVLAGLAAADANWVCG